MLTQAGASKAPNTKSLFCQTKGSHKSEPSLPQQAQTMESISGHTYTRKRILLTLFVKRLILWSEGLSQGLLGNLTCFVCKAVTFFNEIDLHPYNSYYLRNTIKLIRRSSSIIDEYIYPISPRDVKQKTPPNGRFACLGSARSSVYRGSARRLCVRRLCARRFCVRRLYYGDSI